jgi:hypothetical protein
VTKVVNAIVAYFENEMKKSGAISVDGLDEGEERTNDDFSFMEDTLQYGDGIELMENTDSL